jgi:hypothetical protein
MMEFNVDSDIGNENESDESGPDQEYLLGNDVVVVPSTSCV